jgi:hypothetical protein
MRATQPRTCSSRCAAAPDGEIPVIWSPASRSQAPAAQLARRRGRREAVGGGLPPAMRGARSQPSRSRLIADARLASGPLPQPPRRPAQVAGGREHGGGAHQQQRGCRSHQGIVAVQQRAAGFAGRGGLTRPPGLGPPPGCRCRCDSRRSRGAGAPRPAGADSKHGRGALRRGSARAEPCDQAGRQAVQHRARAAAPRRRPPRRQERGGRGGRGRPRQRQARTAGRRWVRPRELHWAGAAAAGAAGAQHWQPPGRGRLAAPVAGGAGEGGGQGQEAADGDGQRQDQRGHRHPAAK